jgi:hypothetical protein
MPLRTNKGSAVVCRINGQLSRIGPLPRTLPNCRDEVIEAFEALIARDGDRPFSPHEIYAQMLGRGTKYAELTVYKAMQRMKLPDPRRADVLLVRSKCGGFQLVSGVPQGAQPGPSSEHRIAAT